MDDAYHNGMNTPYGGVPQRQSYDHANTFQPQHYQDHSHEDAQTLPPIQAQRPVLQHASNSYDQHYRPQGLPYATSTASYQSYYGQGISQAPYAQGMPPYAANPSFPPHTTQAAMNLEYASAPGQSSLPILRPMPSAGYDPNSRNAVVGAQDAAGGRANPLRPVVGSQGRRGILPSDDGRPPVGVEDGDPTSKANFNPAKGPDGKYACPHCPKTYLHAKHLKRHHLRHTGDRPYSCVLCGETFSRSDILKRHFQKCSIRRGNPTGATHLSNSQSHLRKQGAKKQEIPGGTGSAFSIVTPTDPSPYGSDSNRSLSNYSSSEQMKRYSDSAVLRDGRPAVNSPSIPGQSNFSLPGQKGSASLPSSGGSTPVTSKKSGLSSASFTPEIPQQPRMDGYSGDMPSMPRHPNNMSHLPRTPHGSEFTNWPPFDQNGRDGVGDRVPVPSAEHVRPDDAEMKPHYPLAEEQQSDFMNSFLARGGAGTADGMNGWTLPDSLLSKTERLISFCQLDGSDDPDALVLRRFLAPENVEEFYGHYLDFHAHWPFLNMASFDVARTYDGLVLAMICVGAVYSEHASIHEARAGLKYTKRILKTSEAFRLSQSPTVDMSQIQSREYKIAEQLQALALIDGVAPWHGDEELRNDAINCCGQYVHLARSIGLFAPSGPGSQSYSILHQPQSTVHVSVEDWDWAAWLRQERQIRLVMHLFVLDAALMIYFNKPASFDPTEVHLPLPADDAAYDAPTADGCAVALGLYGDVTSTETNVSGTRMRKQPDLDAVLHALHSTDPAELPPRSTNAFSKFILSHALLVQIHNVRRRIFLGASLDTDAALAYLRKIAAALIKWRKAWQRDLPIQYPPTAPARSGFGRDAEPFFFIAKLLLHSSRADLLETAPSVRCQNVMQMLKGAKAWLAKSAQGVGQGDVVDANFGMDDLTWDMKLLFVPLPPPPVRENGAPENPAIKDLGWGPG